MFFRRSMFSSCLKRDTSPASQSLALRQIVPTGYAAIDTPRQIPSEVNMATYINHGGLAIVHQEGLHISQRFLPVAPTGYEYIYGYMSSANRHAIIFGVYRPGLDNVSVTLFDELTAAFKVSTCCVSTIVRF
jgi:hypothetical protein